MKMKRLWKEVSILTALSTMCFRVYASNDLEAIMKARNLSEKDILAAAKTYQP